MRIRLRLRRRPRFVDGAEYMCDGCGWWWEHVRGDRWRGAYWADPERPSGQYPDPGRGGEMTWEQFADHYADCADHLVPLAGRNIACPDCAVPIGQYHVRGCDRAVCKRSGWQRLTCPDADTHECVTRVWTGV